MAHRLLYLVRHGESTADPDAGPDAGSLTDLGRQQAELLAERLRHVPFAAIHHSPWERAAQTAGVIAARFPGVPVHPSDLLRECVPVVPPADRLTAGQVSWFEELSADLVVEGAAQAEAVVARFAGLEGEGQHELLVTHGNLINWFVCRTLDAPSWAWMRMLDYNCALTVIMYLDDRVKVITYNDTGHLPPALRGTDYPPEARI
ncbi:histidine phosphatase family protein [Planosporangium sp. 12N6]|uniref:histidine phosphatase family protein n=1 Tax=Planosporangium spinosum TaxID=3402278 RepID=UPI003CF2A675